MALMTIQVLALVFAVFAWSRAFMRFKDHQINISSFILWSAVWLGLIIAALMPNNARLISKIIGVQRPIDVLIYGSIIVLLYLVFRLYIKVETNNYEITRLVRALAISQAKKK